MYNAFRCTYSEAEVVRCHLRSLSSIMSLGLLASFLAPHVAYSYLGGREGKIEDHPSSVRLYLHFPVASADAPVEGEESVEDSEEAQEPQEPETQTALCTAVKIQPKVYLTAAHCVVSIEGMTCTPKTGEIS